MLLNLTAEWGRVLAPHGSIAIELGDTYSGSGGAGGDYNDGSWRHGQASWRGSASRGMNENGGPGWPRAKCLALIPQLYAVALAYGINPLTGQPSPAGRWLVRNVIVWHRPNPAVGALGDKVRPSTSYIVIATRSPKRWFDLTAVRTALKVPDASGIPRAGTKLDLDGGRRGCLGDYDASMSAGAPPLDTWLDEYDGTHDTWTLTTQPSSLAHYAMWPAKLAERLILSMCPREVCRICGEPRRRVEGKAEYPRTDSDVVPARLAQSNGLRIADGVNQFHEANGANTSVTRTAPTLGWTDCGCGSSSEVDTYGTGSRTRSERTNPEACERFDPRPISDDNYRPGHVLDPFSGSGTTLAVADLHGRDATGIDLDPRSADLYPRRYDEVKRALYGTPAPMPGQGVLAL